MDPNLIAEAMALALDLAYQARLDAADQPVRAAWLAEHVAAVPYDQPSGADPDGFVTVGELRDLREERTGFVLVHPATKDVPIAWGTEFGN